MQYRHAERDNFEDFAAGRVFPHVPGMSHFPVRLAIELFARCLERFPASRRVTVYDPCCGGGYMLAVVGFHFAHRLRGMLGSDIDPHAVAGARRTLALLTEEGMKGRIRALESMVADFGKDSHREALESAANLLEVLRSHSRLGPPVLFEADACDATSLPARPELAARGPVDIVFADVPYGLLTQWRDGPVHAGQPSLHVPEVGGAQPADARADAPPGTRSSLDALLEAVAPLMAPDGIVMLASGKDQKVTHPGWKRLEKENAGKRRIGIYTRIGS